MAAPSDVTVRSESRAEPLGELEALRLEFNKLVTEFRALCTALDADAGVSGTSFFTNHADSAGGGPSLVQVS
jgi:hypothetical protein